jgi:hypothetical protein
MLTSSLKHQNENLNLEKQNYFLNNKSKNIISSKKLDENLL